MKRIFFFFSVLFLSSFIAHAMDTSGWYVYNGYSSEHSFSVNFPTDWKATTIDDEIQGFMPSSKSNPVLTIEEFEGQSFDQVISYYSDESLSLVEVKDELFQTSSEDLIAKKVTFYDINEIKTEKTLLKRGSLIVAINKTPESYSETQAAIEETFQFTADWHQYIDLTNSFTFIFPKSYTIENYDTSVEIIDPSSEEVVFVVDSFQDTEIDDAISSLNGTSQINTEKEDILLHNSLSAIRATYRETISGLYFNKIFIKNGDNTYALTDLNIEDNHPHANYYDEYLIETLESFEFFDVELDNEYFSFLNFTDVRDNHPNVEAINKLYEDKVINGYDNSIFKPDGEINRAELVKMVVAAIKDPDPDKYNNCFIDVKYQWFAPRICYAKEKGWVAGYDSGKFKPEAKINRVEAIKIILEANLDNGVADEEILEKNSHIDIDKKSWYYKYFSYAENNDLLDKQHVEENQYLPGEKITRKEVAEMIYRIQY